MLRSLPAGGSVRGTEGEAAESLGSSPSPSPQRQEQRANTLPEWKQRVSHRKRHHRCANEAWGPGSAARLFIEEKTRLHPSSLDAPGALWYVRGVVKGGPGRGAFAEVLPGLPRPLFISLQVDSVFQQV